MAVFYSEIQEQTIPEDIQCDGVIFSATALKTNRELNNVYKKRALLLH
jgi:hypothetical protein